MCVCALNYADPLLRFSLFTLRADRRQLYRLTLGRTFGRQRTKRQTLSAASLFLSPTSLIAFAATFFVWFCLPCIPFDGWGGGRGCPGKGCNCCTAAISWHSNGLLLSSSKMQLSRCMTSLPSCYPFPYHLCLMLLLLLLLLRPLV